MPLTRISYHDLEPSQSLNELIEERITQLTDLQPRIASVRVVVSAPHHHQRSGTAFDVRVEVRLPRREIVIGSSSPDDAADEDAYHAVRSAFDHARRQLTAVEGKRRAHH